MSFEVLIPSISALLVAAYTFWCGGAPERAGSLVLVGWIASDQIYHLAFAGMIFNEFDPGHFVMDGLQFLGFVAIALRANRWWPIVASGALTLSLVGHFVILFGYSGLPMAYWILMQVPFFVLLAALSLGTVAHRRRVLRVGSYRDWRVT